MSDREVMGAMAATLRKQEAELAELRATLAEREAQILEDNAVCICPCPPDEHEGYGEDGESCGNDCECLRVSDGVKQVADGLRNALREREAEIERLRKENYLTGEGPSHLVPRVQLDRARAALATARKEALKKALEMVGVTRAGSCAKDPGNDAWRWACDCVETLVRGALASDTRGGCD